MSSTPKTLTVTECHQLLDALMPKKATHKQHRRGIRNYTMALLMLDAGLRVGEVVKLYEEDFVIAGQIKSALTVPALIAKNKRERTIPLSGRIRSALEDMVICWWTPRPDVTEKWAFVKTLIGGRITTRQVERIIRAAAMKSIGRPIHPHILRHTFATRIMRVTNMRTTQELLGHEHLSSTQIYTHPNQEDLKYAIAQLSQGEMILEQQLNSSALGPDATDRSNTSDTDSDVG